MTQEEKQLLLQDLCARLPYGVKIKLGDFNYQVCGYNSEKPLPLKIWYYYRNSSKSLIDVYLEDYHPYLRPMSSMTEEEKIELKQISNDYLDEWENTKSSLERWKLDAKESYKRAMFYNSHHLDWNDLISKGLAIAVTEDNNPYKES